MEIPFSAFAQIGAAGLGWALFGFTCYMVVTGRLVPGSLYQEAREEARLWREVADRIRDQRDSLLIPAIQGLLDMLKVLPNQQQLEASSEEHSTEVEIG